ncbi:hypothetical protein FA13DRAFT_1733612 [Coprinellus micaceus]|uniref:Uncharacterized protein n=1 Tax=Coprinellus micaceus TaxID=71717 RepID=A0A4Y7T9S7_COPMI|nr:hypothetical protein FA13DRAFT_1733612 [Coprinellus micaceus]
MTTTGPGEELSWRELAEAKTSCLALATSPNKAKALKRLSIVGPTLGLNGCRASAEQQEDIDIVLETVKNLPNLVELNLQDNPYTWIPTNWLVSKLEKLVVHDPDDSVDILLSSQPSVRHLEFWSLQNPMQWSEPAQETVLPMLERVEGYPAVIQHYVPGRPVHTVRVPMITNIVPVHEILEVVQQSAVNVTTLDLAVQEKERYSAVTDIATTLGDSLTSLTVHYHRGKKIDTREAISVLLDDWVTGLSKATRLCSFSPMIWFSNYPEGDGEFIVQQLGEACSSLQAVRFRGATWVLEGQGWVERT